MSSTVPSSVSFSRSDVSNLLGLLHVTLGVKSRPFRAFGFRSRVTCLPLEALNLCVLLTRSRLSWRRSLKLERGDWGPSCRESGSGRAAGVSVSGQGLREFVPVASHHRRERVVTQLLMLVSGIDAAPTVSRPTRVPAPILDIRVTVGLQGRRAGVGEPSRRLSTADIRQRRSEYVPSG